jgi:hypothetical protein
MLLFKACARCHGDMQVNGDFYGDYKQCLQCGMTVDIEREDDLLVTMLREHTATAKQTAEAKKVA